MFVPRTMDCMKWFVCLFVLMEFCTRSSGQKKFDNYIKDAGSIYETLFHKYNARVLPWNQYPDPMRLNITLTPVYVAGVDPVQQTMTSTSDITITWNDGSLGWYTKQIAELTVNKDSVWHPHINFNNVVGPVTIVDRPDLILSRGGDVIMRQRVELTTTCPTELDASEFSCSIKVGVMLYDTDMLVFNEKNSSIDASKVIVAHTVQLTNASWSITKELNLTMEATPEPEVDEEIEMDGNETTTAEAVMTTTPAAAVEVVEERKFAEFVGTLTFSKTDCCGDYGMNGATSISSLSLLTIAVALVIALFAQQ